MAINPRYAEQLARDLLELYTEAETRMLEIVAKELADDIYAPDWAAIKQSEISRVKAKLEKQVANLDKKMPETAAETVKKAYTTGQKGIEVDLKKLDKPIKTGFGTIDERKVMVLTRQLAGTLGQTHLRITRQSLDEYRSIIGKASQMVELGVETRQQATQRALNEFADKGITGFIDKAGRSWSLRSYAEMATRSTTGQAAIEGAIQRLQDNDYDLVIVSFHADSCPLCEPWEGQVLSISGKSDEYPALDTAIAEGLFHPNCGHSLGAYIPGLTEKPTKEQVGKGDFEEAQEQRKLERDIRRWKQRQAVAITDEEKKKAASKVREKQAKLREFLDDTGRKRQRDRESV
jgi:nitrogen regulatory protein PII-like uncharacterized protein